MSIQHTPDESRARARRLIERLHDSAGRASPGLRAMLEEAACLLDGYQAGLEVATPHHLTGYALVRCPVVAPRPSQAVRAVADEVSA